MDKVFLIAFDKCLRLFLLGKIIFLFNDVLFCSDMHARIAKKDIEKIGILKGYFVCFLQSLS